MNPERNNRAGSLLRLRFGVKPPLVLKASRRPVSQSHFPLGNETVTSGTERSFLDQLFSQREPSCLPAGLSTIFQHNSVLGK